ncbi:hypothetical protein ACQPYK_13950 [Streptosporangium sp. CA-135522]|uniref:hypothetical protein n=1 Tax=Streptosporangium sp. CA-135522 TaxID=3240072 RepID=UPI003D8ED479
MAEFVGIDPAGARRLINSMGEAIQRAQTLRPFLSASIAEAGPDWPAGSGAEVLDNVGRFLDEACRDLTWRTQTIERIEDAVSKGGLKTAEFVFGDAASAQTAGALAGKRALAAWQDYMKDPGVKSWEKVRAALGESRGKTTDAAYSAGLLATLGATAFGAIFAAAGARNQNDRRGYSPQSLEKVGEDLNPLAEAFASTDVAGTLPKTLRDHALNGLPIGDMAALLGLARQSRGFLVQAGAKLAQYGGHREDEEDWNTYWLVKALSQNGEATQELLASGDNAALLLRPEVVNDEGRPGFKQLLATALDKALAPGAGDPTLRRNAWINVIKVFGDKTAWPSLLPEPSKTEYFAPLDGQPSDKRYLPGDTKITPVPSPIGQVLARHIAQYFPQLAAVWSSGHDSPGPTLNDGWQKLDSDRIASFFAGLLRDPAGLPLLKNGYDVFLGGLDLGKEHPFGSASTEEARQEQRELFYGKAVAAGAMASLLFNGLHEADLDAEEKHKFAVELLFLPVDAMIGGFAGKVIGDGIWEGAMAGKIADLQWKNTAQDAIEGFLDEGSPEEASNLVDVLVEGQVSAFNASRRHHGQPPLADSDIRQLKDIFYGRLEPVLEAALRARGG